MDAKCKTYFTQGLKAAMNEGKKPQNWAACNIYRIQKGIPAPGLGKGGRRGTRKDSRKSRRNNHRSTRKDSRSRRNNRR